MRIEGREAESVISVLLPLGRCNMENGVGVIKVSPDFPVFHRTPLCTWLLCKEFWHCWKILFTEK